jgi:hypothetical protein
MRHDTHDLVSSAFAACKLDSKPPACGEHVIRACPHARLLLGEAGTGVAYPWGQAAYLDRLRWTLPRHAHARLFCTLQTCPPC